MFVDPEEALLGVVVQLRVTFPKERLEDAAMATCYIGCGLIDGNFELDMGMGKIAYRISAYYKECRVKENLIRILLGRSRFAMEHCDGQLAALAKGEITLAEFQEKV